MAMIKFKQARELLRMRRQGASLGDVVVMKFDLLSKPPVGMNERLRELGGGCFDVDMEALRKLPAGTLGREFARLLDDRGLPPLDVSVAMREKYKDNPYPLRYTTTHDLFHVLTGFRTTMAGEMGLLAFMMAQGFDVGSPVQLWASIFAYSFLLPLHVPGMIQNMRVGAEMGKKAKNLLLEPLESYLAEPLSELRPRLGLPDPDSVGMVKGHSSLVIDWIEKMTSPPQRVAA